VVRYHHHNPYYSALKRGRKVISKSAGDLVHLREQTARSEAEMNILVVEGRREKERRAEDIASCQALAAELKECARAKLARHLGDPASTSALTSGELPIPSPRKPQGAATPNRATGPA
jgi:hypothetical protein